MNNNPLERTTSTPMTREAINRMVTTTIEKKAEEAEEAAMTALLERAFKRGYGLGFDFTGEE